MKPTSIDYLKMTKKWPSIGQRIKENYLPDQIAQVMCLFFSEKKTLKFPSLIHTENKGLLLSGPKGSGKTLSFEIYRKLLLFDANYSKRVKIISVMEIESQYKQAKEQRTAEEYFNSLVEYPELVIDDLGLEQNEYNDFGTIRNLISDLLMLRYPLFVRGEVITHATTNLTHIEFPQLYDSRLIDRMKEMFVLHILPSNMTSKRSNPIKFIPSEKVLPEPMSQRKKNLIYINHFIDALKTETSTTFYDLGLMWKILTSNGYVNESSLLDFDLETYAKRQVENNNLKRKGFLNDAQFSDFIISNPAESEVEKIMKHKIMKDFLLNNEIDFEKLPSNKIVL